MTDDFSVNSRHVHPRKPMKTAMTLLAQYEKAIIPVEAICRDYFTRFARKAASFMWGMNSANE